MRFDKRVDIDEFRRQVKDGIDREAGEIRSHFITSTAGQEMVYWAKQQEAERVVADPAMGAGVPVAETPHVSSEAEKYGVSRFDKAVEILSIAQAWANVSPLIETRRLAAKDLVDSANTIAEIRSASQINWDDVKAMIS